MIISRANLVYDNERYKMGPLGLFLYRACVPFASSLPSTSQRFDCCELDWTHSS